MLQQKPNEFQKTIEVMDDILQTTERHLGFDFPRGFDTIHHDILVHILDSIGFHSPIAGANEAQCLISEQLRPYVEYATNVGCQVDENLCSIVPSH
ncbi:hypothetical protein Trydic_g6439 [Trypoxylus dichotomus]